MRSTGRPQRSPVCHVRPRFGQLGIALVLAAATLTLSATAAPQASATTAVQISAGRGLHTCALTTESGVKCWGQNSNGQLGDGTTADSTTPVDVSGLPSGIVQLSAGSSHTCALTTDGGVKCWGFNGYGQLGDGTKRDSTKPVDVSGLSSVVQISAGGFYTCALTIGGGVKCWGVNYNGELGDGTTTHRLTPVDVTGLSSGIVQLSAGGGHTCAVTTGGGAKCWGWNGYGQLGNGRIAVRVPTPVDVVGLSSGVAQISAGDARTCALTTSNGAKCWGFNGYGQLGNGTTIDSSLPMGVVDLSFGETFRPDARIKRPSAATYRGNGIYNTTALDQTVTARVVAGNSAIFHIKIQNDGSTDDPMRLAGCSGSSGFVATYSTWRGTNITVETVAGTRLTRRLPVGGVYKFILRISAPSTAASGDKKACKVIATSVSDATQQDAVKARLIVR